MEVKGELIKFIQDPSGVISYRTNKIVPSSTLREVLIGSKSYFVPKVPDGMVRGYVVKCIVYLSTKMDISRANWEHIHLIENVCNDTFIDTAGNEFLVENMNMYINVLKRYIPSDGCLFVTLD
jgi:hypothetical protein